MARLQSRAGDQPDLIPEDKTEAADVASIAAEPRQQSGDPVLFRQGQVKLPGVLARIKIKELRPGQNRAVSNILLGKDTIALLPTGAGKTFIYVVPTVCHNWRCLIFSPLVSLMQDQVENLWRLGFKAGQLSSGQTKAENDMTLNQWECGNLNFLLVAPERQDNDRFQEAMQKVKPQLVVLDEAHCLSTWGDSFRPSYVKIGKFIDRYRPQSVLAMTATATPEVEADIRRVLGMQKAALVIYYPKRANLKLSCLEFRDNPEQGYSQHKDWARETALAPIVNREILREINQIKGSVIVYALTKKRCDEMYKALHERIDGGALVYHGGMDAAERTSNQNLFMNNDVRVVFATNAFGMGINKPDIRGVIHRDVPGSVEALTQEDGRAGRDGLDARCVTCVCDDAFQTSQFFIESTFPPQLRVEQVYHFLQKTKDPAGIVKMTGKEISDRMGINERVVSSALGILASNHVVERSKEGDTIIQIKVFKEHLDDKYQHIIDSIRRLGQMRDGFLCLDFASLVTETKQKAAGLKTSLRDLDKNGYLKYIAPFGGKTTRVVGTLDQVDFERLEVKRGEAYGKLDHLLAYIATPDESKHDFMLDYFKVADR